MIKDRIMLGMIAGMVGNAAKTVLDEIFLATGKAKTPYRDMASGIFVNKNKTKTEEGKLLGWLADLGLGMVYGIPLVYLLSHTGADKYPVKGALMGTVTWGLGIGVAKNLGVSKVYPKDPATILLMALSHMAGGIVAAHTAVKLGDRQLFEPATDQTPEIPS